MPSVNTRNYCTYFDSGFLIQGLALLDSLRRHDTDSVLWVLAFDDACARWLQALQEPSLRVVRLAEIEAGDGELVAAKQNRSRVEYYFTLSPCWPLWLLKRYPEIERVTYLDADMLFFAEPDGLFREMDLAGASVLITEHRFPDWLAHYNKHGQFNVGILSFRNDAVGRECLGDWRSRCLVWCYDRLEDGKYADQKYLEDWPVRFGSAVLVLQNVGVNAAPWNWARHRWAISAEDRVSVDNQPLVLFHFARFRPIFGTWWWQSGHLDYGIMPWRVRQAIYGIYWQALCESRARLRVLDADVDFNRRVLRFDRSFWRGLLLRVLFGSDWLRVGEMWISGRCGLGRLSGQVLARLRTIFLRR
jgi:hypothetical protein